jgi:hypothetical protein
LHFEFLFAFLFCTIKTIALTAGNQSPSPINENNGTSPPATASTKRALLIFNTNPLCFGQQHLPAFGRTQSVTQLCIKNAIELQRETCSKLRQHLSIF